VGSPYPVTVGQDPKDPGAKPSSTAAIVRDRVTNGDADYWRYHDFTDLPASAVAMALSRLAREGSLQRVGKGVYYRPHRTSLGPSGPSASGIAAQTLRAPVHPAGLNAANVLGLSTQNPRRAEYATSAAGPPTGLRDAVVHTGRPPGRAGLSVEDGAILETLRERARYSDLSPQRTIDRLRRLLSDEDHFRRLAAAALEEPPRVRAILGALGEESGMPESTLAPLRESLNPLSRFDFGTLGSLQFARRWQAK
jgi:hypothetical protein